MRDRPRSLDLFIKEISGKKPLTREQEDRLSRIIMHRGGAAKWAASELSAHNYGFVFKVAGFYKNHGVPFEDLIQEGAIGMNDAAWRYDYNKQFNRFISYAKPYVLQHIQRVVAKTGNAVSFPTNATGWMGVARRTLEAQGGRGSLTTQDLRELSERDHAHLLPAFEMLRRPDRLDVPIDSSAGASQNCPTRKDMLPDETSPHDGYAEAGDLSRCAEAILERLSEYRERPMVEMYYGLDGGGGMSLEAVGKEFGLTRERVRQIIVKAKAKILINSRRSHLRELGAVIGLDGGKVDDIVKKFANSQTVAAGEKSRWVGRVPAK